MKKRGFTLVELLTVIVILGVVFLFIVPRLSTLIKKGEKNQKDILEERVLIAAKEYVSNYNRNFYDSLVNEGDYNYVYRTDLLKSGLVDENELKELGNNLVGVKGELLDNDNIKYTLAYIDNPVNGYCEDEVYLMIQQLQNRLTNVENGGGSGSADTTELNQKINNLENEINTLKDESKALSAYPVGSIYISYNNTNPGDIFGGTWESFSKGKTLVGLDENDNDFKTAGNTGGNKSVGYTPSGTVGNTTLTVNQIPSHNHSIPALSGTAASNGAHTHTVTTNAKNGVGSTSSAGSHNHAGAQWVLWDKGIGDYQHDRTAQVGNYNSPWVNTSEWRTTYDGAHTHTLNIPALSGTAASNGAHTHTVTTNASTTGNQGGSQSHTHTFSGTSSNISVLDPYTVVYMWKRTA